MSSDLDLEDRYRRVLRLLPGYYRDKWEEDMVAAFLDSWHSGDHVLFPPLPVVAGQQPQHPPVSLLQAQAAAHPAAPAAAGPVWPSLARTARAAAA